MNTSSCVSATQRVKSSNSLSPSRLITPYFAPTYVQDVACYRTFLKLFCTLSLGLDRLSFDTPFAYFFFFEGVKIENDFFKGGFDPLDIREQQGFFSQNALPAMENVCGNFEEKKSEGHPDHWPKNLDFSITFSPSTILDFFSHSCIWASLGYLLIPYLTIFFKFEGVKSKINFSW